METEHKRINDEKVVVSNDVWYYECEDGIEIYRHHSFPNGKEFDGHIFLPVQFLHLSLGKIQNHTIQRFDEWYAENTDFFEDEEELD